MFFLLGILYGGVHLTLWNYAFATHTELLLWRISGITLLAVPTSMVVTYTGCGVGGAIRQSWKKRSDRRSGSKTNTTTGPPRRKNYLYRRLRKALDIIEVVIGAVLMLVALVVAIALSLAAMGGMLLYVCSRVFIVVESHCVIRNPQAHQLIG